jgi:3-hydroxybutyryl-CoA dehydrogenase
VIASVINEAYFTFGAGISTKDAIDTAMKLGTNYPFGPFEWGKLIGLNRVYTLLKELSRRDNRYEPAPALLKEIEE